MTDLLVSLSPQRLKGSVPFLLFLQASHSSLNVIRIDNPEAKEKFPSLSQVSVLPHELCLSRWQVFWLENNSFAYLIFRFFLKMVVLVWFSVHPCSFCYLKGPKEQRLGGGSITWKEIKKKKSFSVQKWNDWRIMHQSSSASWRSTNLLALPLFRVRHI